MNEMEIEQNEAEAITEARLIEGLEEIEGEKEVEEGVEGIEVKRG